MKKKEKLLIDISLILLISIFVSVGFLTRILDRTIGLLISIFIYWFIFSIPTIYYYIKKENILLSSLFKEGKRSILNILAFIPTIIAFIFIFMPIINKVPFKVIVIAFIYGVLNGFIEEVFFHGLFNHASDNKDLAFIYPTIVFIILHMSIFLAKGMIFKYGFSIIIFGIVFTGSIWSYIMYKTKSLKTLVLAHQITSFFILTGFIYENWFI